MTSFAHIFLIANSFVESADFLKTIKILSKCWKYFLKTELWRYLCHLNNYIIYAVANKLVDKIKEISNKPSSNKGNICCIFLETVGNGVIKYG